MSPSSPKNAVLDDQELLEGLSSINPRFGDFCSRVAGEAWGMPLIDQATKALIAIAIDVTIQNMQQESSAFNAHVSMARKQGITWEQLEELILFCAVYAGFNKSASVFGKLKDLKNQESTNI